MLEIEVNEQNVTRMLHLKLYSGLIEFVCGTILRLGIVVAPTCRLWPLCNCHGFFFTSHCALSFELDPKPNT